MSSISADERPLIVTIPTELQRKEAFWDFFLLIMVIMGGYKVNEDFGVPWSYLAIGLIPLALQMLTGEAASDVGFVGNLAAAVRSRFGQRRAHEWLLAVWHYVRLYLGPRWGKACIAFLKSLRQRISAWPMKLNGAIRWRPSPKS